MGFQALEHSFLPDDFFSDATGFRFRIFGGAFRGLAFADRETVAADVPDSDKPYAAAVVGNHLQRADVSPAFLEGFLGYHIEADFQPLAFKPFHCLHVKVSPRQPCFPGPFRGRELFIELGDSG